MHKKAAVPLFAVQQPFFSYRTAPAPTLKISTNTPLAEKKGGWIDFNTGVIADGEKTIDEAAKDLLDLVIRVACGEQTKAEKHGFREISIFKDVVVL